MTKNSTPTHPSVQHSYTNRIKWKHMHQQTPDTCRHVHACMHACIHMYIHTHIRMHTYINTYIHTYIHTYILTYIYKYICVMTHALQNLEVYRPNYLSMCACAQVCQTCTCFREKKHKGNMPSAPCLATDYSSFQCQFSRSSRLLQQAGCWRSGWPKLSTVEPQTLSPLPRP